MEQNRKLPIGIENFKEIRTKGFYYVDKTGMIRELLQNWGKVNLFTRPRRFGKTLNMSMLKYFFEYGCDSNLFEGLEIAKETELCETHMGKYPVISITLKGVDAKTYVGARQMLMALLSKEASRFEFLEQSERLSPEEKERYDRLKRLDLAQEKSDVELEEIIMNSLQTLSLLLYKHFGQEVVLLIDEYDVPLDKAERSGYYEEMISLIRGLLGQALKTNDSLQFAVLTGCLRIAKESIFTGLNNFRVHSISQVAFEEYFGFSSQEVLTMLEYYGQEDKFALIKEWYDGYRFGKTEVYCPWDVINYCYELRFDPEALPKAYWVNTSGNDIIRIFLQKAESGMRRELEQLIDGQTITKKISEELTYRDLYNNTANLWSILFMTGYLTQRGKGNTDNPEYYDAYDAYRIGDTYELVIPNLEIRQIFVEQVMEWVQEEIRKDTWKLEEFCNAFLNGAADIVEKLFAAFLRKTISIRDTAVRKNQKENFYHGILLGLLSYRADWYIQSNAESGDGYSDILIEDEEKGIGIVIEVKYAEEGDLESECAEALEQIEKRRYEEKLLQDGMETIVKYGIACERKRCRVRKK